MYFNSFAFIVFIVITFLVYYACKKTAQQVWVLIIASLIFYGFQIPTLVLVLLISAGINILASFYINMAGQRRKVVAILAVIFNLALLCFFKYSAPFADIFLKNGTSVSNFLQTIAVPLGVSFYTFEGISLVVDVYKNNDRANKHLAPADFFTHCRDSLFFISFFPHLVSGPILKAHNFLPQIGLKKTKDIPWEMCFKTIITGFFLKMVVSDNLADFTEQITYPFFLSQHSITLILMPFGFLFQIFADFAGYSLIAVGIARIFGYQLIYNFNFPLISSSFKEFWQRWNISLSSFLAEYLYIPLGGNRKGTVRTYFNIMFTMFIGGLWHGATLSFALWGTFHGIALCIERLLKTDKIFNRSSLTKFTGIFILVTFVAYIGVLFKLDLSQLFLYLKAIFTNYRLYHRADITRYLIIYSAPIIIYHALYLSKGTPVFAWIKKHEYFVFAIMLFLIMTNSGISTPFIYFQF